MARKVSELVVKLTDQVTGPAAKMKAALEKAQKDLGKVQGYRDQKAALDKMAAAHQKERENVRQLGAALMAADRPTRAMQNAYERATQAADKLGNRLQWQQARVRGAASALGEMGVNISKLAAGENQLRAAVERASAAIVKQEAAAARSARRRQALGTLAAGAGVIAGYKVRHGAKEVLHTYREFDNERRYAKAVLGLSDDEMKPLVNQAIHGGATSRYNDIQWLHGQRDLAARGVSKEAILGMMPNAADLGMATGQDLPEAVKMMENAIFTFQKKVGSVADASASAKQTADVIVKAMKMSGMTPEDISHAYTFGAPSANMGNLGESNLLAFAGILKKAGIGGDQAGTAFRALTSTIFAPTAGAKTAMRAQGLNYADYQKSPDSLALDPFVDNIAQKYGVALDKEARAAIGKVFSDKSIISDPAKFTPAIMAALAEYLGGDDAKSKKSIAGEANRYRDASMKDVDSLAMFRDLVTNLRGNIGFANKLFGAKQGSRIATALKSQETFDKFMSMLEGSKDYAQNIAKERMSGFDGAASMLENSLKNLATNIGRAWDGDGEGGVLTKVTKTAAEWTQRLAEMSKESAVAGSAIAGLGGAALGIGSTVKLVNDLLGGNGPAVMLTGSAVALGKSALALDAAAARLAVGGGIPGAVTPATAAGAGKPKPWGSKIARMLVGGLALTGVGYGAIEAFKYGEENNWGGAWSESNTIAKSMREQERQKAALRRARDRELEARHSKIFAGTASASELGLGTVGGIGGFGFGAHGTNGQKSIVDTSQIEAVKDKATEAKEAFDGLNTTANPAVNLSSIMQLKRELQEIEQLMSRIGAGANAAKASVSGIKSAAASGRGRSEVAQATARLQQSRLSNEQDRPTYG